MSKIKQEYNTKKNIKILKMSNKKIYNLKTKQSKQNTKMS